MSGNCWSLRLVGRSLCGAAGAALLVALGATGWPAAAQAPEARTQAARQDSEHLLWEPAVAGGGPGAGKLLTLYSVLNSDVYYAVYDVTTETWQTGPGPIPGASGAHDPSIAYNTRSGRFVGLARWPRPVPELNKLVINW